VSARRPVDKDFDDAGVRSAKGPSLADLWSPEAFELFGPPRDTPYDVGVRFNNEGVSAVLDIGCGTGAFKESYRGRWVGLDRSVEQLRETKGERVLADARSLPFADETFEGVVALYVLYFFEDPGAVVEEAKRVLRRGGLFGVCAPSRYDCPELHQVLPEEAFDESFAAEDIPDVMNAYFERVELNQWDAPMFDFPDQATVRDYLYAHYYPLFTPQQAADRAARVRTPLKLTKKGAWAVGRKPV
jgi:SAM-dependent methyltransferase